MKARPAVYWLVKTAIPSGGRGGVIVDLVGKGNRVRTVPNPSWVKMAIDEWANAANIKTGRMFRGVYHYGNKLLPESKGITPQAIYYAFQDALYLIPF